LATDSVLPTIVETVAQSLRLPYAAIALYERKDPPSGSGGTRIVAEFGKPPTEVIHLPLSYPTNRVGELLLASRAPGESLSPADMHLLSIIAQQAGIAAHTVRLTDELHQLNVDLRQSRQRLVTAQEEERRRLRRDLHDGIGPTLASLSQRLDTAADLAASSPQASLEMLQELKVQVKGVLVEIRRLVYNLRPPVLDEFGLVSAIREHLAPYTGPNGLQVTLNASEPMPPLSAAVEVAAYRIALEAFTNVLQHAQARSCQIDIYVENEWLSLQISDDGKGISVFTHSGVGFTSMRERASELGGECSMEENPTGGLRVRARLPLPKE
jgi:signal transduction histidine kinase